MASIRYGLPLAIFLLGCALLLIDGGGNTEEAAQEEFARTGLLPDERA